HVFDRSSRPETAQPRIMKNRVGKGRFLSHYSSVTATPRSGLRSWFLIGPRRHGHNRVVVPIARGAPGFLRGFPSMSYMMIMTVAVMSSCLVHAAPIEPVPPRVPARLPDRFEMLAPSQIHLGGWLGARIDANEKNRLLKV